jgi:hypothetical protein
VSTVVFTSLNCSDADLSGVYQHTSTKLHSETAYFTHTFNALTIRSLYLHSGADKERKTEGINVISNRVNGLSYAQA